MKPIADVCDEFSLEVAHASAQCMPVDNALPVSVCDADVQCTWPSILTRHSSSLLQVSLSFQNVWNQCFLRATAYCLVRTRMTSQHCCQGPRKWGGGRRAPWKIPRATDAFGPLAYAKNNAAQGSTYTLYSKRGTAVTTLVASVTDNSPVRYIANQL